MRALLPRHSVVKVAYPSVESLGLAKGAALWAVGSSTMLLGDRLAALDSPTLLPPGSEWISLVARAACIDLPAHEIHPRLLASQIVISDELGASLDLHALEGQPRVVQLLRELVEPWLTGGDAGEGEEEEAEEEPCPICLSLKHAGTSQLPRLRCGVCGNGFHASCIYRWLEGRAGDLKCPLCQSAL